MLQRLSFAQFPAARIAFSVCGLVAILGSVGLMGCAATPSTANLPRVEVPVPDSNAAKAESFSPTVIAQLRAEMAVKGWLYQGESKAANANNIYFVKPQSLLRVGNFARYTQLEIREMPVQIGAEWIYSSTMTVQMDCVNRTRQILNAEVFADRSTVRRVGVANNPLQPGPVRLGTADDIFLLRACSGSFGGGQVAGVPGQAPAPPRANQNSSGSGILFAKGVVVTNNHVISQCAKVEVVYSGQRYPAQVKKRDEKNDLALLDVLNLSSASYPALRRKALSGESVMVAGYPLSGMLSSDVIVTDGIVNALSGAANNASQLQISAPVQPGNSGGPLIDKSGAVIGVVVSKFNALRAAAVTGDVAQNINFAIKPEVLRTFLESESFSLVSTDVGLRLDTEVIAEKAKSFTLKVECKNS
jgi:S1-C subfamily serine protease